MDRNRFQAINVLHFETSIKSSIKTSQPALSKAVLHELYVEKGLSQREIAGLFASSKTTILRALHHHNIPIRGKGVSKAHHPKHAPYGKKLVNGEHIECEAESRVIRDILRLNELETSNRAIARYLSNKSIPTRTGGNSWSAEVVRTIIMREKLQDNKINFREN